MLCSIAESQSRSDYQGDRPFYYFYVLTKQYLFLSNH